MTLPLRDLLEHLATALPAARRDGAPASVLERAVARVTIDSRQVRAGVVFVACPGALSTSKDGHAFLAQARAAGAVALVVSDLARTAAALAVTTCAEVDDCAIIEVNDTRRAAALLAEHAAGSPSSRVQLVGVTGTNGKTSTTWLVAALLEGAGRPAAVLGTLGAGRLPKPAYTGFTTPEAEVVSEKLAQLAADGVRAVAMETTSIALATARADGLTYACTAFTNLTRDHLDFHGTMDAYFAAKVRLFTELAPKAPAVLPADDDADGWNARVRALRPDAITWGTSARARLRAVDVAHGAHGIRGALVFGGAREEFTSPLVGAFNVENLLVAAGCALALGVSLADVARGLASAHAPPGRMQRLSAVSSDHAARGPSVVVDFAHTPDALERALHALRGLGSGKLFAVFGAGGDRDAGKRPLMGAIAADVADAVVVTDDNPRSEDGDAIAGAIEDGIARSASKKARVAPKDLAPGTFTRARARRFAIRTAILAAQDDDIVLLAGKGAEDTQTEGSRVLPFDDALEAGRALRGEPAPAFLDDAFIRAALAGRQLEVRGTPPDILRGVCTDSRRVEPKALFVALAGENFDGHAYVQASLSAGASAALVSRTNALVASGALAADTGALYVVDDTLLALQDLARAHLARLAARRIAITGSNGKTTTKQLVNAALAEAFGAAAVVATMGNLNNHIGLPLTALTVEPEHEAAILEMGMNHLGEIALLADIAQPSVGVITNMGTAHAGNVGGIEGVAKAKSELWEQMAVQARAGASAPGATTRGVAVVNADDPRCVREAQARSSHLRSVSFGRAQWADVRLASARDLETGGQSLEIVVAAPSANAGGPRTVESRVELTLATTIPLEGRHNALNACAAIAVGVALGLDPAVCARGIAKVERPHGRLERARAANGAVVLDDTYNANPDSMEAAFAALDDIAGTKRKIIALGEMRELGSLAEQAHRHIGAAAAQHGAAVLFACGEHGKLYGEGAALHGLTGARFVWAPDSRALAPLVRAAIAPEDVVLVKGSRGARMEHVVDALTEKTGATH